MTNAPPDSVAWPKHDDPDDDTVDVTQKDGGARHILDAFRERVSFGTEVVDDPLDRRVQQFDDQNQDKRRDHQRRGNGVHWQNDRERHQKNCEQQILAKRRLVLERREKAVDRIFNRRDEITEAASFQLGRGVGERHG